jgi:sortase (surface protein transpeptidase)
VNFAVAGHRVTHGAPFGHLDQLQGCDDIVVDDRATTWTTGCCPHPLADLWAAD